MHALSHPIGALQQRTMVSQHCLMPYVPRAFPAREAIGERIAALPGLSNSCVFHRCFPGVDPQTANAWLFRTELGVPADRADQIARGGRPKRKRQPVIFDSSTNGVQGLPWKEGWISLRALLGSASVLSSLRPPDHRCKAASNWPSPAAAAR